MIWPGLVFMWLITRGTEYLDDPPDFDLGLREARTLLARLSRHDALGSPDFDRGVCGECGRIHHPRWRHGRFGDREGEAYAATSFCRLPLCRRCKTRRVDAANRIEHGVSIIEPPIPRPFVTPPMHEPINAKEEAAE